MVCKAIYILCGGERYEGYDAQQKFGEWGACEGISNSLLVYNSSNQSSPICSSDDEPYEFAHDVVVGGGVRRRVSSDRVFSMESRQQLEALQHAHL
jgi:hypothetical protein